MSRSSRDSTLPVVPPSTSQPVSAGVVGVSVGSVSRPNSALISLESVFRSISVQSLFKENAVALLDNPTYLPLLNKDANPGANNSLLASVVVQSLEDYTDQLIPCPSLLLLPLVKGFDTAVGSTIVDVDIPTPVVWASNCVHFPLMVCALLVRAGRSVSLVYGGTILPPGLTYYGLSDGELGVEWNVPTSLLARMRVLVPIEELLPALRNSLQSRIPSLDAKIPGLNPVSSKSTYVHPDGIYSWSVFESARPSAEDERTSRLIVRCTPVDRFKFIQNDQQKISIDPDTFVSRLIGISLCQSDEVPLHCSRMFGLYFSTIRFLRIVENPLALSRFYTGKWLGTYQFHSLSLFHFLPSSHVGYDYVNKTSDIFVSFRNFLLFLSWSFGGSWDNLFASEQLKWQSQFPWSQCRPWVLHLCLDKAIASWFLFLNTSAAVYQYRGVDTAMSKLVSLLDANLTPAKLLEVKESYDTLYSFQVVYPCIECVVPPAIPGVRPAPLLDSPISSSLSLGGEPKKAKVAKSSKIDSPFPENASASSSHYCFANIAYIYDFELEAPYVGSCKDCSSSVACVHGKHYSRNNRPDALMLIQALHQLHNRSPFCEALLNSLINFKK